MKIELTKLQKKHIKSIEWLINDERATGKTFLLAVCFIKKAVSNYGFWVRPFDHYQSISGKENLMNTIKHIIGQDKELSKRAEFSFEEFRIN